MYYYDPNGKSPRRWAAIAAAAYVLLIAASFALVSFDFRKIHDKPGDTILVDFTEPPVPERPKPPVKAATEPLWATCPNLRIPVRRAGKSSSALRWTPRAR